jgi:hypothetical protein
MSLTVASRSKKVLPTTARGLEKWVRILFRVWTYLYVRVVLSKELDHSLVQGAPPYVYKLGKRSRRHRLHRPVALFNITWCKFIRRSWDRASWYISIRKPTTRTICEFTEYHSTCFERSFRPSSEVQDCTHSIRYMSYRLVDCMLASTRWHSFHLVPARQRSTNLYGIYLMLCVVSNSWWWTERPSETCRVIFNKLENCASSWFYYMNVNLCLNADFMQRLFCSCYTLQNMV